ncbi:MAG: serine/threonine-protein kinase, partial [Gemmatimonadales bacterium]
MLRALLEQPYNVDSLPDSSVGGYFGHLRTPVSGRSRPMETVTKDTPDPELSTIGEHYVVDRELGRGGMATVYLCTDTRNGSHAAVKVLRHELGSAVVIERFLREISYASELDHPRIPKVLDSGMVGDLPYYAMTYIEGESLRKRLERDKQLDIDDAVRIACEAISATSYAHKRGIVHRDIKPDNILLGESGVFVLDFGIARAIVESGGDRLTSTGIGVGTPAYMSPEQALGDRTLDARSDIYSLGCVLYEMVAGIPPFVGPTAQVIISRRFAAAAPPLREVRDGVPQWLEDAIARALHKSPTDRWRTADDFARALTAPGRSNEISGSRSSVLHRPMARIAVAVVALAVVAAGLAAWSMGRRGSMEDAQSALRAWNFPTADDELKHVVVGNSSDPVAQLALAQLSMLRGEPATQWKPYALYAMDHQQQLKDVDKK